MAATFASGRYQRRVKPCKSYRDTRNEFEKTDIWLCFRGTEGVREKSQERDKFSGDGGGEEAVGVSREEEKKKKTEER